MSPDSLPDDPKQTCIFSAILSPHNVRPALIAAWRFEDLDADDEFESNVKTIKESYFSGEKSKLQLDEEVVSDSDENTSTENKVLDPCMAAYSAAIGKVDPNKYS